MGSKCAPAASAIGGVAEARLLILDGDVQQGLALLDQAGVATVSGDLDPFSTGVVYCELVCALQGLAQYDLAEEWTEAMERWCETNAVGSIHGRCRVHRAEILRLRGSCNEAESQALMACEELRPYLRRELGWPLNELGRIRLHKADIPGAEEALLAAHRAGWDPQPGLALVRLAQGDAAAAAASIRDALEHPMRVPSKERPPNTDLHRAPLLEAQVEIEIAAGDIGRARSAADELALVATRFQNKALVAGAALARGRVRLADGDAAGAEQSLSEAVRLWNEVGAPRYLARLLADPGREYHVLDLVAAETDSGAQVHTSQSATPRSALGDAGEILDTRAKNAYRRRLAEIDDDIDQARALGDTQRAAQADTERAFLVRDLAGAFGLGGRDRRAASASERARAAVTRAVRQAMARIGEHHPQLGEHLSRTIRTGTYCAYLPDPRAPARWEL